MIACLVHRLLCRPRQDRSGHAGPVEVLLLGCMAGLDRCCGTSTRLPGMVLATTLATVPFVTRGLIPLMREQGTEICLLRETASNRQHEVLVKKTRTL